MRPETPRDVSGYMVGISLCTLGVVFGLVTNWTWWATLAAVCGVGIVACLMLYLSDEEEDHHDEPEDEWR